jgi:osmotically-inducible protein OsmY
MTLDRRIQQMVLATLEHEPGLDAAQIGVSVVDAVVTLQGTVPGFRQKWLAERAARHIASVRAVANDLDVIRADASASDATIAQAVADALDSESAVPAGRVKATVRHGWLVLNGTTTWAFQRAAAERAARRVAGVKGVANSITIEPQLSVGDLQARIEEAFRRTAEVDAHGVKVEARNGTVVLSGTVRSYNEREAAERAAATAPGVSQVDDRLIVAPYERS